MQLTPEQEKKFDRWRVVSSNRDVALPDAFQAGWQAALASMASTKPKCKEGPMDDATKMSESSIIKWSYEDFMDNPNGPIHNESCFEAGWKAHARFMAPSPSQQDVLREALRSAIGELNRQVAIWGREPEGLREFPISCANQEIARLEQALAQSPSSETRPACRWTWDSDGFWKTGCEQAFSFEPHGEKPQGFHWCPFCGKPIDCVPPTTEDK